MKILLVYPNVRGMNMLPPSMALFSALLKEDGHQVSLFDSTDFPNPEVMVFDSDKQKESNLNVRPFDDSLLKVSHKEENVFAAFRKHVLNFRPDLLAVTTTEDMFPMAIQLLQTVYDLKIPSILGGVFATFAPKIVMSYKEVNFVCVGEGEHVLLELCRRLERKQSYEDIPGLGFRKHGKYYKQNPMGKAVDMNANPKLDLSIFNEGRLYRPMQGKVWLMLPLETHRGCPFKCTYCNSPSQSYKYDEETQSSFFRKKRFDLIYDEIKYFKEKYNAEAFYFWADTFFAYTQKEFDQFVEMYSEFKIPFWCQTRPETVTRDRVQKLVDVGMFRMAFGIEHGSHEFRKKYLKRNVQNEKIVKAMHIINDVGVPFSVNNILGFPHETRDLTFHTIELNRQFKSDSTNAYSFSPFHGTELRTIAEEAGFIEKGLIARSLMRPTLLKMPQYTPESIEGLRRCFVMYTKFPKSRWKDIEKAEKFTPEGNRIWDELRQEVLDKYMPAGDEDGNAVEKDDKKDKAPVDKAFEKMAMGS